MILTKEQENFIDNEIIPSIIREEKEKIMEQMLDMMKDYVKHFREVTSENLAHTYLGQLLGFGIYFNIVAAREAKLATKL